MTILDKIRKARELVAAMDAIKHFGFQSFVEIDEANAQRWRASNACLALIRDDELLALGEEVDSLRREVFRVTGLAEGWEVAAKQERKRAEAAEAEAARWRTGEIAALARCAELADKLAAAEGDARRWRKLTDPNTSFTITVNGEMLTAAADAAIGAGE